MADVRSAHRIDGVMIMLSEHQHLYRAAARALTVNHSRAVARALTVNHSRAVARALTVNHSRAVGRGLMLNHSRAVTAAGRA
jgi:hypothetical protein